MLRNFKGLAGLMTCGIGILTMAAAESSAEFTRSMNLGKAHLENRSSAPAIEQFSIATRLQPRAGAAWRNLARAQMLARQDEAALESLRRARELERERAATAYLTGLAQAHLSRFSLAVPFFEEAVRLDPRTAPLRFQLANAYQLTGKASQAHAQFQETVLLDPLHASAQFKLGTLALQSGDRDEYQRRHQEFLRLRSLFDDSTRTPTALERCLYTEPEAPPGGAAFSSPDLAVTWTPVTATGGLRGGVVLEVTASGGILVFAIGANDQGLILSSTNEGLWAVSFQGALDLPAGPVGGVLAGNFHDDPPSGVRYDPARHARNDVLVITTNGVALLKQTLEGGLANVTESGGLSGVAGWHGCWVDYDHDGDLDLALAELEGLRLWQNNGNGTFSDVTAQVGLSAAVGARAVIAVDLDNDGAVDLIVARGDQPTLVYMNQRAGRFALRADPPGAWPPARGLLAQDLDNDGEVDVLMWDDQSATVIYGKGGERKRLEGEGAGGPWALLDHDNDGWVDLISVGHGRQHVWRSLAGKEFARQSIADVAGIQGTVAADFDGDGDTDLLLMGRETTLLRNEGGNRHGQLKVRLLGTKTNPAGLGTRVEARAGEFWVTRWVSSLPLEIGLGRGRQLDSLRVVWSNGIQDNQINLALPRDPLLILEKNVAAGSCPYLYAWDGAKFRFITDLLGNAPVGLSLRRGVLMPADPDEFVTIGRELAPVDGHFELQVTEELREILYLDQARLVAVDHPPEVEVHPTDKLQPPPFPESELWALGRLRAPTRVWGDDGIDRTEAVRQIDGVFGAPGRPLPPPLRGMCEPLVLTMDFAAPLPRTNAVLALTGWLQYGDASVNIALSQNPSVTVAPPALQAEDGQGRWIDLEAVVGMPAGKTKTIVCALELPEGCRRLRLRTTFELRWDRVAVFERLAPIAPHAQAPVQAELYWRGFSDIRSRMPEHPATPEFDEVRPFPPWHTTPQGWCTRYGDVLDLIIKRDERLALLNGGDALRLRFDAAGYPPIPAGLVRTFFFYSVGWDKDEDHNVEGGDRVEPLPVGEGEDWVWRWNTRWVPRVLGR